MSKTAMKLALEALEHVVYWDNGKPEWEYAHKAITALRQAQPEQELVAAECKFDREQKWVRCEIAHHNLVQSEPHKWPGYQTRLLYTSPQPAQRPWIGLTDEEIWKFWWSRPEVPEGEDDSMEAEFVAAVRAVLAAHGIKENT